MANFTETFRNIFKIHELRQRILYTLALLTIVRVGAHITIPGIDAALLAESTKHATSDNLFGERNKLKRVLNFPLHHCKQVLKA